MKKFVYQCNTYQKVTSAEEDFNNVDRIIYSVYIVAVCTLYIQSTSFPRHPSHRPIGSWTKWPRQGDGGYTWGQKDTLLKLSNLNLATSAAKCPCIHAETNTEDLIQHCSPESSASCLAFSIVKGETFCSYWNRHTRYKFAIPACSAFAKTTICGLIEYLIHHYEIPYSSISGQGAHLTSKEAQQWIYAHRIHWSYHVPHHPEATENGRMAFEDPVTVQARWECLAELR